MILKHIVLHSRMLLVIIVIHEKEKILSAYYGFSIKLVKHKCKFEHTQTRS